MTSVGSICHSNGASPLNINEGKIVSISALENIPRSRTKHSSCLCFGHLYVFGGRDGTVGLKDSWRYNIERHLWEKLEFKGNQLPYLEGHSSVAINEKIVIFGGNFENDLSSPLWFFDVNDFSCSSIFIEEAMVPLSRRGHTACSYGKDLYVFGGFLDFLGCTDELWRLSSIHTKSPKWELLYSAQNVSKSFSQKNTRLSPDGLKTIQSSFVEGFAQMSGVGPSPRSYHASAILRDDMFVHGGERGQKVLASFWRWNFTTGSWLHLKVKPSPPPLKRHSMVAAGQTTLLLVGGETSGTSSDFVFWGYNVNTSSWFKLSDPTADDFKIDLAGFVTLNISEVDGLSLMTLWSDTISAGNITEITDFSCSAGFTSNFCHEEVNDDPCRETQESRRFPNEINCFLEGHKEAARKLSNHKPADSASAFSSPLHSKTSFPNDIEMDNLNDSRNLLKSESSSEKPLTFDNDCFDFDESNSRRYSPTPPTSEAMTKTCKSGATDVEADIDRSLDPHFRKMKKDKKCHLLALVGGKNKSRRRLATSPLSIMLLSCDQVTCKINNILLY